MSGHLAEGTPWPEGPNPHGPEKIRESRRGAN